jgi:2-oxoisovalerate dehydrogenase E2 component (dihydrolipoyl transacylase)
MSIFRLPDLGEGLPDAEITEWHVNVGDEVKVDQPLVSMETAKAVVEVPSPQAGKISLLHGKAGDIIKTGAPLVEFDGGEAAKPAAKADTGTVVGNIETSDKVVEEASGVAQKKAGATGVKATPAVRALARKLGVDLSCVTPSAANGVVSADDVKRYNDMLSDVGELEPLRGARRAMAYNMVKSHDEVVPVTIYDNADIHAWKDGEDITVRLIQALIKACKAEPAVNAWFDNQAFGRRLHQHVNLGLAMDTGEQLFVPVLHKADEMSAEQIRAAVDDYKQKVRDQSITPEEMRGASISLSNFGKFAGRYANSLIVPPMVAIIAIGKKYDEVVAHEGQAAVHPVLPISLSFDHRGVTGGEATRFLGVFIEALQAS